MMETHARAEGLHRRLARVRLVPGGAAGACGPFAPQGVCEDQRRRQAILWATLGQAPGRSRLVALPPSRLRTSMQWILVNLEGEMRRRHRIAAVRRTAAVSAVVAFVALGWAAPASAVKRRAFATSVEGTGDLSTWPDASGATALARADAICRARAAAVLPTPLPNAATYRAWISTSTTDAYCHVQGLAGKKANDCNGAALPGAGPWFLSNGATNFSGTLDRLVDDGEIYRPISRDENFDALPLAGTDRVYWTGTDSTGVWTGVDCDGWANEEPGEFLGTTGDGLATAGLWSKADEFACAGAHRLLCLEPGVGEVARLGWSPAKLAFLSSVPGQGKLADWPQAGDAVGLAAGDAICQTLAAEAFLPAPGSFVAWLSTASPAVNAADRVGSGGSQGPWKRVDAYTIAGDLADLTDSTLDTSLHQFETGDYLTGDCSGFGPCRSWTGTDADGTAAAQTCDDWTDSTGAFSGAYGSSADGPLPVIWSQLGWSSCNVNFRLYCLSTVLTIFWDGFELTHDTSRWSGAVP